MNVKISELKDRVGTAIPGVQGKIIAVFPPKEGTGAKGKWKVQNINIEDATGKIKCSLWNCQTFTEEVKGREIQFFSVGSRGKLVGVSVKLNEYNDKNGVAQKSVQVEVSKSDNIKWADSSIQDHPEDNEPSRNIEDMPSNEPKMPHKSSESLKRDKTPSDRIKQFGKLYEIAWNESIKVSNKFSDRGEFPKDLTKDIATTFFIQAVREGLADKMDLEEDADF